MICLRIEKEVASTVLVASFCDYVTLSPFRSEGAKQINHPLLICPLSSRQVKYLIIVSVFEGQSYKINVRLFFYADHFDLYFSILLFLAIGYDKGCSDVKAAFLTSQGVLQSYLLCGRS